MAAGRPLTHLALAAASVADDLGYVALADLSHALGADATDYRVIGGHMVTALVARWSLGAQLYRETGDADLGVPPIVARNQDLVGRLSALGYRQVAGNRFGKKVPDIPVALAGERHHAQPEAFIDVLVPAYTSRARQNVPVGADLVTTEVPGLAIALARAPISLDLELQRLNGETLRVRLPFPDEVSALVLKCLATRVRAKATDVVDIWRCLEVAFAAGVGPQSFTQGMAAESADIIRGLFIRPDGPGMTALVREQRLSDQAADERFTRIRALIARVIEPG
jgi:hypothetical protein